MEVKQVGRQAANQNWQFVCQKCSMLTLKSHSTVTHTHAHPLHTHTQSKVGSSITRLVEATESRHWPRPRRGYMNARTICMLYVCMYVGVCVCECVCQSFGCHTARFLVACTK